MAGSANGVAVVQDRGDSRRGRVYFMEDDVRYFYTDPIKAAWMSKENGVDISDWPLDDLLYWASCFCGEQSPSDPVKAEKFYIHPDCHALLLPQKGDLVHIVRGFVSYYKEVQDVAKNKGKTTGIWSGGEHWDVDSKEPLHDFEILQRNGKAWFTPEKEE